MKGFPLPPRSELEARERALKERMDRERRERQATRPDNPQLVAMNEKAKVFWEQKNIEFDERIKKYPDDVQYAIDRYNEQMIKQTANGSNPALVDSLEKHVLDLAERDKKLQARRGRKPKRRGPDVLDSLIVKALNEGVSPKKIWDFVCSRIEDTDGLVLDCDAICVEYDPPRPMRRVREVSFPAIVSRIRKGLQRKI